MKNLIWIILLLTTVACNSKGDTATNALEAVLKKTTGVDTDLENLKNPERNKVELDITDEGLNLNERFKEGFGGILATKTGLAITITNEARGHDNMLYNISNVDITTTRPIKGRIVENGKNTMGFALTNYGETQVDMMMGYDVESEIVTLSPEKTVIKIKGKLGYASDNGNPANWKSFEGTITLHYPVFQAADISKESIIY